MTMFRVNEGLGGFWVSRGPAHPSLAISGRFHETHEAAQAEADLAKDAENHQVWDYVRGIQERLAKQAAKP